MARAVRTRGQATAASVDAAEVERFSRLADRWWDPEGEFRPLHLLNPVRLGFIRDQAATHFRRDPLKPRPLDGFAALDIGCGGGLLSEPLARLGASVTAIDASAENIRTAGLHARESGLHIHYQHAAAEDLAARGERYDLVLAMEVVEHVADVAGFLAAAGALVAPGGMFVLSTLNRTPKSFAFAIVGAEYLLRWLPRGTHDWRRFLKPSEVARHLRANGLELDRTTGVVYDPIAGRWSLGRDLGVNYMLSATKAGGHARA
jgi:2-polyprenyl-6-hydroxyphenyl methylase/3-demethylubiquinone-9 3-methyltransferase